MIQCKFSAIYTPKFDLIPLMSRRTKEAVKEPTIESIDYFPRNHSGLYNSMIYPFMRTVIYGSIWYQGKY